MRRLTIALASVLVLSLLAAGIYRLLHAENAPRTLASTLATPSPTVQRRSAFSFGPRPMFARWVMSDNPVISQGDYVFAVQVASLEPYRTRLLYSLSGADANPLVAGPEVYLRDDEGRTYASTKVTVLAQLPRLELGVITLDPRMPAGREMHLVLPSPQGSSPVDAELFRFPGTRQGPDGGEGTKSNLGLNREGYLEQAAYRLSFNGWGVIKGDRNDPAYREQLSRAAAATFAAEPPRGAETLTPVPVNPIKLQLSGGQPVTREGTLRVEDIQTKQVQYLYFVLLQNDEAKATLLQ